MRYIRTYEDNEFDPNNFNKLQRDIKGISIELKDKGFRILPFEVENDIGFDNYDYYLKICKRDIYNALFNIIDIKEYIYTIIDYVGIYYSYDELTIKVDNKKITELAYVYFESNLDKRISLIELCFKDIEKKK
jgi:hypothetical protein